MANNTAQQISLNQQALFRNRLWTPIQCISHLTPNNSLSCQEPIVIFFFFFYKISAFSDSSYAEGNTSPSSLPHAFTSMRIPTWKLHVSPMPAPTQEILPHILLHLFQHYFCKDRWTRRYPILEWALQQGVEMRFPFRNICTIILDTTPKAAFRQKIDKFRFLFSQKTSIHNNIDAAAKK